MPTAFTVGIPVYNEEAIIVANTERLLAFLDGLGRDYEILIGSNGSVDSTTVLGADLTRRFAKVSFFHLPERGVGFAFAEFLRRAAHPHLISVDMDLSIDLTFIRQALALLDEYDMVIGAKRLGRQRRRAFRRLASDGFIRAARLLLGIAYDDYSIAAKAFRVGAVRRYADVVNHGSAYVLELCYLIHRDGGSIVQVPVSCEDWRRSKFNLLHEGIYKYSRLVAFWLRARVFGRL